MTPTQAAIVESHRERRARWNAVAEQRRSARDLGYDGLKSISYAPAPLPIFVQTDFVTPHIFDFHTVPSARNIAALVAMKHGITFEEMIGSRGDLETAARAEAIYLVRTHTNLSSPAIGKVFDRSYSTILYSLKQFSERKGKPMLLDIRIPPRSADDPAMRAHLHLKQQKRKAAQIEARPNLPPLARRRRANDRSWTEVELADVMALTDLRYTRTEIAEAYGMSRSSICGVIFKERRRQFKRLADARSMAA